ncbi:MAG: GNAT family N-acetyltransferase [Cyanobacteriota bacterium]|nr:GNAT family N-acetyltransferase [Cyanobacteriota bacterium]
MNVKLLLGVMRKFTPKGQDLAVDVLKKLRKENCLASINDIPSAVSFLGKTDALEKQLLNKKDSVESIVGDIYKSIKTKGVERKPGTILNTKTHLQEPIVVEEIPELNKNFKSYDVTAYNIEREEIGLARLTPDPNNKMNKFLGIKDKDSLYIEYLATSPNYKGIGTEMLRKIVQASNRMGYSGRVSLEACTGSVPMEFLRICGYGKPQKFSCAIKYKKMGFNSTVPELDAKIEQGIKNGGNGLVIQHFAFGGSGYRDRLSGPMELSQEAIRKYLSPSNLKA